VDSLSAGLLHQQLPDALREPLLTYAGGKASAQLAPALAGLMLASPAFQIY
jgi:hypothetical protein